MKWGSEEDTWRFQREAWALALHDSAVESIVGEFYEDASDGLRPLFLEINPNASEDQLKTAITTFGLFSEGTIILNFHLYGFLASPPQVIDVMIATVLRVLGVQEGDDA